MRDVASPIRVTCGGEGTGGEVVGDNAEGEGDSSYAATGPTATSNGIFTGCGATAPTTTSLFSTSTSSSSSSKYSSY